MLFNLSLIFNSVIDSTPYAQLICGKNNTDAIADSTAKDYSNEQ
jgi:hypothetical protein